MYSERRNRKEEENDPASATIRKAQRIREEAKRAAEAEALAADLEEDDEEEVNFDDDMSSQMALMSIAPPAYVDELSQFAEDVAEAMQSLRNASEQEVTIDNALHACAIVKRLCNGRYYAKSRLGASGAANLLLLLYQKWRDHSQVMVALNNTMSAFVVNETENKIFLGCGGMCADIVYVIKHHSTNYATLQSALRVATDICNAKVQGMIKQHQQKSTQPVVSRITGSEMYIQDLTLDEHYSCDNRNNLFKAGVVPLLTNMLKDFAHNYHTQSAQDKSQTDNVAFHEVVTSICQLVSTLSSSDDISKAFGTENACEYLSTLLLYVAKDKEFYQSLIMALLWAIIILASAPKAGNKQHFHACSVCLPILDLLYDAAEHKTAYQNHNAKEFNHLVEYLAWSLLNLSLTCPENVEAIANVKFSRDTIKSLMEDETIPASNRQKLKHVYQAAFANRRRHSEHIHGDDLHNHAEEDEHKEGPEDVGEESPDHRRQAEGKEEHHGGKHDNKHDHHRHHHHHHHHEDHQSVHKHLEMKHEGHQHVSVHK